MSTPKPHPFALLALSALVVLAASKLSMAPLHAQVVMGQVVDSIAATPVGTGFVVLLDQEGREVARALSTDDGRFRLEAPAGGVYKLRSERIGYGAFTSAPFELEGSETLDRTLRVLAQAIVLAAVEVQGEDRCNTNPNEAVETGIVWQEIRKALAATAWDGTQELARYRLYRYRRNWDTTREEVLSEEGALSEGYAGQPYRSVSLDTLLNEGFVVERADGVWYNLPDAGVLQADSFLASHCFHVVRDSVERPGQIGLAFEPMSQRGLPDVRGALWLDETTSELRLLDVSFTRLPQGVVDRRVGGTVEFMMLPSGAWIVHRWQVRTPSLRVFTGGLRETHDRTQRIGIMGFNDTGGDVLEITTLDGARLYPPGLAHLIGTVYDSSRAGPLAEAAIAIDGTAFWGRSDGRGVAHLAVPAEGEYVATLSHPAIDSIGHLPLGKDVRFVSGDTSTISFNIPHANSISRRICSYPTAVHDSATVLGLVRQGRSGRPARGLDMSASWQVLELEGDRLQPNVIEQVVRTDAAGTYFLCGLPVGLPVTIRANGARSANILFPRQADGLLLFARERDPDDPYRRSFRTRHRTWKVDFLLTGVPPAVPSASVPGVLSGYVTDFSSGQPLRGVTITLNNGDSTVTRSDGTFDLVGVEWRPSDNSIVAHRTGYQPWTKVIGLNVDLPRVELSIQLQR